MQPKFNSKQPALLQQISFNMLNCKLVRILQKLVKINHCDFASCGMPKACKLQFEIEKKLPVKCLGITGFNDTVCLLLVGQSCWSHGQLVMDYLSYIVHIEKCKFACSKDSFGSSYCHCIGLLLIVLIVDSLSPDR